LQKVSEVDVIVAGLGAVGTGILRGLDRLGARTIGIDRHRPPHEMGSSHGFARITREFVGEGAEYVPLVRRSHEIWAELEARGARLRERTGLVYLAREGGGARRHHAEDFVDATRAVARAAGVEMPRLDAAALRAAYPQFAVTDGIVGYLEPEAGFVRPERCVEAQLADLSDRASLALGETIQAVREAGGGVEVVTDAGVHRARRAVLATGAWTPGLAGGAFGALRVLRQVQYWFELTDPGLWRGGPTFLWFHGDGPADVFYGFPPDDGASVKVATEQYEADGDPDLCDRTVSPDEAAAMFEAHVRGRLNGVGPALKQASACLYTFNAAPGREGRFLIGPHPKVPGVTVVSACSGHGFKHSAGLGEAVAQQLLGQTPFCDLSAFAPA
jgi:sarcosine oxidase